MGWVSSLPLRVRVRVRGRVRVRVRGRVRVRVRVRAGGGGRGHATAMRGVCLACVVAVSSVLRAVCALIRTAVNLQLPSSTRVGAQHMRMLDPMHARMPQRPPTTPGGP